MADFYKAILFLNYGLLLSVILLGAAKYRLLDHKEKQYFHCIAFLFFIELLNLVLPYVFKLDDTSFLYPFYIAGEFFLLTGLFIRKLDWPAYIRWIVAFAVAGFMILKYGFNYPANADIAKVISNIIIICLSGYTLIREIKNASTQGRFLLVDACIFFYYSVSVFIFIIQHQIANLSENDYYTLFSANNILSGILYCSFLYTFIRLKK
jgi:ABC-type multidrug transport system fused ATPase/permease subunit